MGWPIVPTNSYRFLYKDEQFALGVTPDEMGGGYVVSLFVKVGDGTWNAVPEALNWQVTNETIAAAGSVRVYLAAWLPKVEEYLRQRYVPEFPSFEDKGACMAYDLATGNVAFDPDTGKFTLDPAPLNHAKPANPPQ